MSLPMPDLIGGADTCPDLLTLLSAGLDVSDAGAAQKALDATTHAPGYTDACADKGASSPGHTMALPSVAAPLDPECQSTWIDPWFLSPLDSLPSSSPQYSDQPLSTPSGGPGTGEEAEQVDLTEYLH